MEEDRSEEFEYTVTMLTSFDGLLSHTRTSGDTRRAAADALFALMTGFSEEVYSAGWLVGLEYLLWKYREHGPGSEGTITKRQCQLLRSLSEECDGWWVYPEDPNKPIIFVRLADWKEHARQYDIAPGGFNFWNDRGKWKHTWQSVRRFLKRQ